MIRAPDAVGVAKVKGHATEAEVDQGRVRAENRLGNIEADTAADQGRRHQTKDVMEVRRALLNPREHWLPVMLQLHRYMVAVSWVSVNDDRGGSATDPLVWDQGSRKKHRKDDTRVNVDVATMLGPLGFLHGSWVQVYGRCIAGEDIAAWPKSVSLLCKLVAF